MTALFHAHSGIRYLVLLVGVIAIGYYAFALATKKPAGKATRVLGSAFVGLFDLQVLVGTALALGGRFYPAVWGHVMMMVMAAAQAHVLLVVNRRRKEPGNALPLVAVVVALVLAVGGIFAIGRGPLTMTASHGASAAAPIADASVQAR